MIDLKEFKELAPLIAICISLIVSITAIINYLLSKKSYNINKLQYQNKQSNFECYLIDNYAMTIGEERIILFHITITNKSETKNTFDLKLKIEYLDENNISTIIKLSHDPENGKKIKSDLTYFPKDVFMNDKESQSKWLIFSYKHKITKQKRIDSYRVIISDVNNQEINISSVIMKKLYNEN